RSWPLPACRLFELPHSRRGLVSTHTVLLLPVTGWRITPIAKLKDRRISHTIHCYYLNCPPPCYRHSMDAVKPVPVESETCYPDFGRSSQPYHRPSPFRSTY